MVISKKLKFEVLVISINFRVLLATKTMSSTEHASLTRPTNTHSLISKRRPVRNQATEPKEFNKDNVNALTFSDLIPLCRSLGISCGKELTAPFLRRLLVDCFPNRFRDGSHATGIVAGHKRHRGIEPVRH